MKLWRADTELCRAVQVECPNDNYSGNDADGKRIYRNTHFRTEEEAWKDLEAEIDAGLSLDISELHECERALTVAKERVVNSAVKVETVRKNRGAREKERK